MALILPKGIVVNSPDINEEIERINTEPLDLADIAKFWRVYTTTKRRLLDPTAERLENYWWRIWGSRKRELNGATVARLFAFISDGQSFVPLRGPPNRDEGTSPPLTRTTRHGPGAASTTALNRSSQNRQDISPNATKSPALLPPILKKTKGPSLSTTTRTARFISPHESEAETHTKSSSDWPKRPISPNSHVVVQPPSPESHVSKPDKKVHGNGVPKKKGFVASTAAKKKRPLITRRQSSQSLTEQNLNGGSSMERSLSGQEEIRDKGKASPRFQENFSPGQSETQSSKRFSARNSGNGKEIVRPGIPLDASLVDADRLDNATPGPSQLGVIENQQAILTEDLTEEELSELELQHMLLAEAKAHMEKRGGQDYDRRKSVRSISGNEAALPDLGAIRMLSHDAKGKAKVGFASTEASGQLQLGSAVPPLQAVTSTEGRGKGRGRDVPNADFFAKRAVPPALASTPAPFPANDSLARSKSQLSLLLEKDRARSTDKSRDGEK